ncbi:subtilisin inhibitor CLSI-I-like [Pecten maximus]|uniref:subtilisin inhibitor CLSI-I-like n=1 Tax=Pecten maximus TaxID=6579 RepID=UPI00145854FB|nr:subtilisin inhibitor CLSI-I-like [Pecten maximus]
MSTTNWPDCVGKTWQEAEAIIRKEYPNISVQVLPDGSMVTMDYRTERVRIFTDETGKIVRVPMIG